MAKTMAFGPDNDVQSYLYATNGAWPVCQTTAARTSIFKTAPRKKRGPFVSAGSVSLAHSQSSCECREGSTF